MSNPTMVDTDSDGINDKFDAALDRQQQLCF
jgi:hypothetical protein